MNNKGKVGKSFIFSMVLLAIIGVGALMIFAPSIQKTALPNGAGAEVGDCETSPTLVVTTNNALEQGTAVTTGKHYFVNGAYLGQSAPASYKAGDEVQLIVNASSYIDTYTDKITMSCGTNRITKDGSEAILIYDYTAPSIEIKEDSTTLTDSATGGSSNASNIVDGGSDSYQVCFTGVDKDSSGDLLYVVELGSTQNVSNVDIAGVEGSTNDVPSFYTNTLTSPYRKAFHIPAVINAPQVCYQMTLSAKSGKDIAGAVYTTAYVKQAFVEDDGSLVMSGVEQADGDTKYEATFDEDFFITEA